MSIEDRSAERRNRMVAHVATSFEDADRWDLEYWQSLTPEERLEVRYLIIGGLAFVYHLGMSQLVVYQGEYQVVVLVTPVIRSAEARRNAARRIVERALRGFALHEPHVHPAWTGGAVAGRLR